jgi:uridine kinase
MKPLVIGIAGGTGSGKTTVARKIAEALPDASAAFLDMDGYYRDFAHPDERAAASEPGPSRCASGSRMDGSGTWVT